MNRYIGKINAEMNGVFSKSNESVFALKGGDVEEIVRLDEPMLVLLYSKMCLHAAQRTEAKPRAGFRKVSARDGRAKSNKCKRS